jgi:hypothetical protein
MTRLHQLAFCAVMAMAVSVGAQNPRGTVALLKNQSVGTNAALALTEKCPVAYFRKLLAMSPEERELSLTNRPPAVRARLLAKVSEYEALSPDDRELRLRATELRWYLTPLMRLPRAERGPQLARVPKNLRDLVQTRLEQWDILPPPLQEEFLANARTLPYFAHVQTTNDPAVALRQKLIAAQFNQFFELTPDEKEAALNTLSDAERAEMEKTLKTFDRLPPQQRQLCVRNYAKFAGMSATERAEFLKNAQRWAQMSPNERQAWRDLVAQVPLWPPMPQDAPPAPPEVPVPPNPATHSN